MTPKEKAGWLNEKFYFALPNNGSFTGINNINDRWNEAKQCALIAVDEITDALEKNGSWNYDYWEKVKQEIELL